MEMNESELVSIKDIYIRKVNGAESSFYSDILSIEEPLEIRISYGSEDKKTHKNISVTMRTPGNDFDLAIGFLFTEGIISSFQNIKKVYHSQKECLSQKKNVVQVDLVDNFVPHLQQSDRNFYTTSSCGVCGKSSIESIKTVSSFKHIENSKLSLSTDVLYQLPQKIKTAQSSFTLTGGIHASALFTIEGELVFLQEDVGRHNALDKLIGRALANNLLPLNSYILLLSGRASFELIQKAAMAGISIVVAIGAPSSLAVELAIEFDITLLGFLKEDRFNIYNSSNQVTILTSYTN
ncbi:formate dehydrogenase accessory sulfurtransferase FdhD [Flavobacterium hibernum]|uniref:Sulfur carrier protein FdhD n=1 Tax=Flavobacterium hibernum TaxID=37752 RepID=A0A0D0ETD9_9FLAO|nr:formate dehydrogenase accessory sulfurtransferase FdhD [Flavobacterium hibernum]KIO51803.1 formate dehydrogenase [Flavobacterium hibernum]OXA91842.1 sulfurtransferase FdhD [Flavobacterium hibernum]STO19029.1 formate dehydrogenase accessory protein [Flavobacterium hibernum]